MLKLEKMRNKEIGVRLRKREKTFNPVFAKALGIALTIHLIGIFGFQIQSFKTGADSPHAPIAVNADLLSENLALALLDTPHPRHRYRLEPQSSSIQLPEMRPPDLMGKIDHTHHHQLFLNSPFQGIEHELTTPTALRLYHPTPPTIEISLTGPLSELHLLNEGKEMIQPFPANSFVVAHYAVQVESKTGEIFWHERLQSTLNPVLDQLSEQMLANMRFQKGSKDFVTKGEIEISFNSSYVTPLGSR